MSKKKTIEEVRTVIEAILGYKLLSTQYINNLAKLNIKCNLGHSYEVSFGNFQQGARCPLCSKNKQKTYDEVKQFVEAEGYRLLSLGYKNIHSKLEIQCDKGHVYKANFNNFKYGNRCPFCDPSKKKTYEEVKEDIESNKGYKLLSTEYQNKEEKLEMQCPKKHIYNATFGSFRNGHRCPDCGSSKRKTYDAVKQTIENIKGYKLLSVEYENNQKLLAISCNKGHVYQAPFAYFIAGNRCPHCASTKRKTYEQIKKMIESVNGYKLLSDIFMNTHSKVEMQCDKGHTFKIRYSHFQQGSRCPDCYSTKGELAISNYLSSKKIIFKNEFKLDNCKYKRPLPFDVAVFGENDKLVCLIEYDGEQHFNACSFFGGEKALKSTKMRDKIKNDYCRDNNIKLIRISYKEFDKIETILNKELNLS